MAKQQTKELLLAKGAEIMHRKGYNDSDIQEVLEATGVPKGSFYYYFKSKEDFGLQDLYSSVMFETLRAKMALTDRSIVDRVRGFFREMTDHVVESAFTGCPLGNLAQEMGYASEPFRLKLNEIFKRLESEVAECLREAQAAGEIGPSVDPDDLAVFLVSGWEGALLRMKLTQDKTPFDIFDQTAFGDMLVRA